jgi:hypothetical protein
LQNQQAIESWNRKWRAEANESIIVAERRALAPYECDAIEAVENASFRFGTASYLANASAIGLAHGSKRAIQRNMAEYGVGTFVAKQKKYILKSSIEKRIIWDLSVDLLPTARRISEIR